MLRDECIQFQVYKNPVFKFAVVEQAHRTNRDRLQNYFTYKYSYRYMVVLPIFIKSYNDTVNTTTRMGPSRVTDEDFLAI